MNESILASPDVDYTQALPIQQKRIIAFINHFIMNTVSFLNSFAQSCETRLMEFEFKLRKVDASLKILESQLSSIPEDTLSKPGFNESVQTKREQTDPNFLENAPEMADSTPDETLEFIPGKENPDASIDASYSKYFKMLQVGVPLPAVKLKMSSEGLDPNILDSYKS
ncbi:hypothetical protein WA026_015663 [Henosepilachna vigintioctopunctata]|uniref:WASH complex subunit 3 n=1 Tax=Henosepilachna vigintioctopunctata TaxID=420089 RepID=A0AAW1VH54_9CUCU